MNLILHPGHSKCGSSSIQQFLFDNRKALESKGYAIPDMNFYFGYEKESDFTIERPVVGFLNKTERTKEYENLRTRLETAIERAKDSNIHTFIISAENLSSPNSGTLNKIISEYFKTAKVVYYIRRQDDFNLSAWQQWGFKMGKTLEEFGEGQLRDKRPKYGTIAGMLKMLYGRDAIEVVPFSREVFYQKGLIADFLQRTELGNLDDFVTIKRDSNKSLNPLVCNYLVKHAHLFSGPHDNRPELFLEKYIKKEPWLFETPKSYLQPSVRKEFLKTFEEENRALQKEYFPEISYETIFGENFKRDEALLEKHAIPFARFQKSFLDDWVARKLATITVNKFNVFKEKVKNNLKRLF